MRRKNGMQIILGPRTTNERSGKWYGVEWIRVEQSEVECSGMAKGGVVWGGVGVSESMSEVGSQ